MAKEKKVNKSTELFEPTKQSEARTNPNVGPEYDTLVQRVCTMAIMTLLGVFNEGKNKCKTSLWTMGPRDHAIRAIAHNKAYVDGDESEPNLQHALWRTVIAMYKDAHSGGENVVLCPRCFNKMKQTDHDFEGERKFLCGICEVTLIIAKPPETDNTKAENIVDFITNDNNKGEDIGTNGTTT